MSYDSVRQEAQRIADSFPLTTADREAVTDLALPDSGPLIEWAKAYVRPHLPAFLDRVVREACTGKSRGGRESFWLFTYLALGWAGKADTTINVFLDRLGVTEQDARKAIDSVAQVEGLSEDQSAELCARFLRSYMSAPERRSQVYTWLGITEA